MKHGGNVDWHHPSCNFNLAKSSDLSWMLIQNLSEPLPLYFFFSFLLSILSFFLNCNKWIQIYWYLPTWGCRLVVATFGKTPSECYIGNNFSCILSLKVLPFFIFSTKIWISIRLIILVFLECVEVVHNNSRVINHFQTGSYGRL